MFRCCEIIWLACLIVLLNFTSQNDKLEKFICLNSVKLNYLAINDQLVAYYRRPHNESFDQVTYQATSSLELNFDLSPTKILFQNRNPVTKLIRREDDFRFFFNSPNNLKLIAFRKNDFKLNEELCNESTRNCLIKNYNHCWVGNLPPKYSYTLNSSHSSFNASLSNSWVHSSNSSYYSLICTKSGRFVHYESGSNKSRFFSILNAKNSAGLAFVKLRNMPGENWVIFGDKVASLYLYDSNALISRWPVRDLYQPNDLFFGCPQSFCVKASFDDIVYDASNHIIIFYRGPYYYQTKMSNVSINLRDEIKPQVDSYYLTTKFAKLISDDSLIEQLQYFDAVELIPFYARTHRIHIKDDIVYTFDHFDNTLINQMKLTHFLPEPRPHLVDSMFRFMNHLNIFSGNYIYSYFYHHTSRTFSFRSLGFKFRLPSYIEATFIIKNQVYFFKENQFYHTKLDSKHTDLATSGPVVVFDRFLTNCSNELQVIGRQLKDENMNENYIESYKQDPDVSYSLPSIVIFAVVIVLLIMITIGLCIYCEFLSPRKRSYFMDSLRNKSTGLILKGNSNSSPSGREFLKMLETSRLRFLAKNRLLEEKDESTESITNKTNLNRKTDHALKQFDNRKVVMNKMTTKFTIKVTRHVATKK